MSGATEDLAPRIAEGWERPAALYDDGHRLVGHRIYVAGVGVGTVRAFTKGQFGASAHTVELEALGGLCRGSWVTVVAKAMARQRPGLDSEKAALLLPGERVEVKEVRCVAEGEPLRVRVFIKPTADHPDAKGNAWVSLTKKDGTPQLVTAEQQAALEEASVSLNPPPPPVRACANQPT